MLPDHAGYVIVMRPVRCLTVAAPGRMHADAMQMRRCFNLHHPDELDRLVICSA
jgi:hypothetical protein